MKKIYFLIFLIVISYSCKEEFLEEELVSTLTADYFGTPQGLNECINASYNVLRWRFNGEHGYCLTNYGVDEMTIGNGPDMVQYNNYGDQLDPDESDNYDDRFLGITDVWKDLFYAIKLCNIGLEYVETVTEEPFNSEEKRLDAKAQLLFLKAFSYFDLVQQWGEVPLLSKNSNKILTDLPKSSVEEVYNQIIIDLEEAEKHLFLEATEPGRITKGAARHYLAKVYLTRASEVNRSWNTNYEDDLQKAIDYAEMVLPETGSESIYMLEPDYAGLFDYTGPDGPNESSAEIILAAQFTNNESTLGDPDSYHRGNKMHLYVGSWYEDLPGLTRDIENGRPWRRLCPTDYAFDVFDRENDSRFYKSFKFVYISNTSSGIPGWNVTDLMRFSNPISWYTYDTADDGTIDSTLHAKVPNPSKNLYGDVDTLREGTQKFAQGDTALVYLVNSLAEPIDQRHIDTSAYTIFARYIRDNEGIISNEMPDYDKQHYLPISKYFDNSRLDVAQEEGYRDGIIARLAETYLIAAEAYGRLGNYAKAMENINYLRERAAYKGGEARHNVYYRIENDNRTNPSTVDNLMIQDAGELTTLPKDTVLATYVPPSVDSPEEIFLMHILNERSRELMCELHRWEDLVRTETLIERATLYNGSPDDINGSAQPIAGKHELRPIPQSFIDALQKEDGTPYTIQEKTEYQNPKY